jgi:hypothetical protein
MNGQVKQINNRRTGDQKSGGYKSQFRLDLGEIRDGLLEPRESGADVADCIKEKPFDHLGQLLSDADCNTN